MSPDHFTPRDTRPWPGGFYMANVHDLVHVRPAFGCVFLSTSHSLTGARVSTELMPAEALSLSADLASAARLAICAQSLAPGDEWSFGMPGLPALLAPAPDLESSP